MPPTIITKESLYKRITELERKHCCGKNQFFDSFEDFPEEGQKGILYIDESTGDIYVWVVDAFVLAGDKFHSNIVGTGAYDAGLPLTNWTPPSGAIDGNTAQVKFTDGVVVNYTYNGTTWVVDFVDDAAVSGTGATNRVAFWSDANTLTSDADLYWDATNNMLNVGHSGVYDGYKLNVAGNSSFRVPADVASNRGITIIPDVFNGNQKIKGIGANGTFSIETESTSTGNTDTYVKMQPNVGIITFGTGAAGGGSAAERMRISDTGNVGIGTTTPANKLDVVGSVSIGPSAPQALANATLNIVGTNDTRSIRLGSSNYGIALQQPGDTNYLRFVKMDGSANEIMRIGGDGAVTINGSSPHESAVLQADSTTKGFLPPRMTAAQAGAITAAEGLLLYVTDTNGTFTAKGWWGYDGAAWTKLNN